MNAERRNEIKKAIGFLEEAKAIIEDCCSGEQDSYDSMPENMQSGDKGEKIQEAISSLEEAGSNVGDAISNLDSAGE